MACCNSAFLTFGDVIYPYFQAAHLYICPAVANPRQSRAGHAPPSLDEMPAIGYGGCLASMTICPCLGEKGDRPLPVTMILDADDCELLWLLALVLRSNVPLTGINETPCAVISAITVPPLQLFISQCRPAELVTTSPSVTHSIHRLGPSRSCGSSRRGFDRTT